MKQRREVLSLKTVYTFAWHRKISRRALQEATDKEQGRIPNCIVSQVFSAFCVEACLNHVGSRVIKSWEILERRLSPKEKLTLIANELKFSPNFGERPYQTFTEMFKLRNWLAHGKTEYITKHAVLELDQSEDMPSPNSTLDKSISLEKAKHFFEDANEICRDLLRLADEQEELLFVTDTTDWWAQPAEES